MFVINTIKTHTPVQYFRNLILTGLFLGSGMLSLVLIIFFIFPDNSDEGRQINEWCAEYMPEASRSECFAETGW